MKLDSQTAKMVIQVMNSQLGIDRMDAADYKKTYSKVFKFLNVHPKTGVPVGGVNQEVYLDNKHNEALVLASRAHLKKGLSDFLKTHHKISLSANWGRQELSGIFKALELDALKELKSLYKHVGYISSELDREILLSKVRILEKTQCSEGGSMVLE